MGTQGGGAAVTSSDVNIASLWWKHRQTKDISAAGF